MMKGISVAEFGGPDVMKVVDIAMPAAREGEVLVKVYAAGMHSDELSSTALMPHSGAHIALCTHTISHAGGHAPAFRSRLK
jgi:D-arabinose 1-dehydrogenase-like Zn-dependent alcohol dehydrogenase